MVIEDWGAFFERYRPMALRFVSGLTRNQDLAEDIFQDAARSVIERTATGSLKFESPAHARNYLFRALHNLAITAATSPRSRSVQTDQNPAEVVLDTRPEPDQAMAETEESRAHDQTLSTLTHALEALPQRDREALSLRFGEGLGFREMAQRTGLAISTLQSRVESALGKIRKKVGKTKSDE